MGTIMVDLKECVPLFGEILVGVTAHQRAPSAAPTPSAGAYVLADPARRTRC